MLIKKLKPNVFDVFMGKGFDNWSRIRRGHWGVSVVQGNRLPKSALREIQDALN